LAEELKSLLNEQIWVLIGLSVMFLMRNMIESMVSGLMVFIGNDYNADDIVEVDGRPGRIVRVGFSKTVFFLYSLDKVGNIAGGSKLVIQNDKLKDLKIEKPLQELDLKRFKNSWNGVDRRDDA
jgi:hypothetical protein